MEKTKKYSDSELYEMHVDFLLFLLEDLLDDQNFNESMILHSNHYQYLKTFEIKKLKKIKNE